jgi:hypothetical protein
LSSAYQITLKPVVGTSAINYAAEVGLRAGDNYAGNGNDLRVFQWTVTNWTSRPFNFDTNNHEVFVTGVTNFSAFAISQIVPPIMNLQTFAGGFAFRFTPVPNCAETLERSTNLVAWTPVCTFTATNAQPVTLQDSSAPAGKAFYRLNLNTP